MHVCVLLLGGKPEAIAQLFRTDVPLTSDARIDVLCDVTHVRHNGGILVEILDLLLEETDRNGVADADVTAGWTD